MFSTKFSSYFFVIMLLGSFLPADISRDKLIAPVCNMISKSIPRAIENHPGDEKPIIFKTTTIIENIAAIIAIKIHTVPTLTKTSSVKTISALKPCKVNEKKFIFDSPAYLCPRLIGILFILSPEDMTVAAK